MGVPIGAVTVGVSVVSLYAGLLVYLGLGAAQKFHSVSVLYAFGFSAAIVALFTLVAQSSAAYLLISGGSLVFLAFVVGWLFGDHFR